MDDIPTKKLIKAFIADMDPFTKKLIKAFIADMDPFTKNLIKVFIAIALLVLIYKYI